MDDGQRVDLSHPDWRVEIENDSLGAHAWVAVIVGTKGKEGKDLFIWDSDAQECIEKHGIKFNKTLLGPQRDLYKFLIGQNMGIKRVQLQYEANTQPALLTTDATPKVA